MSRVTETILFTMSMGAIVAAVVSVSVIAITDLAQCSSSSQREITWRLESMKTQRSSSESIVIISDQVFEWEKIANDFSMHEDWMKHKARAILKLDSLEIFIPALQAKIDQCS